MSGDKTKGSRLRCAWNRLIIAYKEKYPHEIFLAFKDEYEHEAVRLVTLEEIMQYADNKEVQTLGGKEVLVSKNNPYMKKIIAEGEEAMERMETAKIQKQLRNQKQKGQYA